MVGKPFGSGMASRARPCCRAIRLILPVVDGTPDSGEYKTPASRGRLFICICFTVLIVLISFSTPASVPPPFDVSWRLCARTVTRSVSLLSRAWSSAVHCSWTSILAARRSIRCVTPVSLLVELPPEDQQEEEEEEEEDHDGDAMECIVVVEIK